MKLFAALGALVFFVALVVGLGLLLAWPTAYLINFTFTPAVLTAVFGVAKMTALRTWVLSIVLSLLFYRPSSK